MKLFFLVAGLMMSFNALAADKTLSCVDPKVNNSPVVLSYTIAGTRSARLASNILYQGQIISAAQVAQYKASADLFLLLDDASTNTTPILTFTADNCGKSPFTGYLYTYSSTGKVSSKALKCSLN